MMEDGVKTLFFSAARIAGGVILGLSLLLFLLYMLQEKLIFYPQPISDVEAKRISGLRTGMEDVEIRTKDGISLRGWFVRNSALPESPLIIYFGGNAEEVSCNIFEADGYNGWSLALINYRGYGLSEGKPGEKNLFNDSLEIYDYFTRRNDIDSKRIIVMGRSLGTGVAVYVAHMRSVQAVILVSPFDSLTSLGKDIFPYLPVKLILRHRFDSIARAPLISVPLLALIASADDIIPRKHSEKLVEKWGGPRSLEIIDGRAHNSISNSEAYWHSIRKFLERF
jgi:uncharacterized protein